MSHMNSRMRKVVYDFLKMKYGAICQMCRMSENERQLEVDHINGNPEDDREKNLQTLCNNCHAYKTHAFKDYATPGRKTLKESKKNGLLTRLIKK